MLLQVFANLVGNALKFTEEGGKVTIRAYHPSHPKARPSLWPTCDVQDAAHPPGNGSEPAPSQPVANLVRIEIADTGLGINKDDQAAIFDRFFRVENRVHTLEGTGLGLSIVRNIMEKHNSQIHLTSEEGVGTIFWFDLAVYQKDDQEAGEDSNEDGERSPTLASTTL